MGSRHTPGPWEWDEQGGGVTGPSGKRIVTTGLALTTGNHPVGEPEANARLIAAAPDLLAACRAVLADSDIGTSIELDGDPDEPVHDGDGAEWFTVGLVAQLQAAVAKATKP